MNPRIQGPAILGLPGVLPFLNARELFKVRSLCRQRPTAPPTPEDPAEAEAASRVASLLRAAQTPGCDAPAEATTDICSPLDLPVRHGAGAQTWLEALDEVESWDAMREASSSTADALPDNRSLFLGVRRLAELEVMTRRTFPFGSL